MKHATRILVMAVMVTGAVTLGAAPSGAGAPVTNTVTIDKTVVGTAPAGTTFTVEVNCQSNLGPAAQAPTVIMFDATGTPTSPNSVHPGAGMTCTATETGDGGASSVAYACAMQHGSTDQSGPPFQGNCTADNVANFGDVIGDSATITVTNTFTPAPSTTTTTTAPPETPSAQAVQATPVFTG